MMKQDPMTERIERLRRDFALSGGDIEERFLELRVEVDRLRLELATLKTFLGEVYPGFAEQYPQRLTRTIEDVDPEFS